MHLIAASPFDDPTKALLNGAFDRVVSALAQENAACEANADLHETIAQAIVDLANAGQRDTAQLERYAESRGRQFLHGLLTPAV